MDKKQQTTKQLTPYERVMLARDKRRPRMSDFVDALFTDFVELKGDRCTGEDPAVLAGIAAFCGKPVTVIGHRRGKTTQENIDCNFGMASPAGYRKALRLMRLSERFQRPVITLVDTPGAWPGMEAEAGGQANAIAENLAAMSSLSVPVISVITGEGCSGGALALAAGDIVCMLENAVYSILSPEGFASILWKDPSRMREACEVMRLTAGELKDCGLIDQVIPEKNLMKNLSRSIGRALEKLEAMTPKERQARRYQKFRAIDGAFRPLRDPAA